MALSRDGDRAANALRQEAAEWFARLRGSDADRYRLDFERWRALDPRHRSAYAEIEQTYRSAGALADTPTGRARSLPRRRISFSMMAGPRAAIASLVVVVALASGAFYLSRSGAPSSSVAKTDASLATRIGEIDSIKLVDGSTVTLDTNSTLQLAFTRTVRLVHLSQGRARFDVAHDATRPFMVEAGGRIVTAHGTMFDVRVTREGMQVTLLRGAVDVRLATPRAGEGALAARLVPGQIFSDAGSERAPQVSPAPKGNDQWAKGMLSFDGAPLESVIEEANRYSTHKIRLGEPELARLRVTGAFRAVPTDALAASLAATFGLRVEHVAQGDYVLHAH